MKIACIGGAHIDRHAVLKGPLVPATSNPGNVSTSFGGVARNVAENLARLGRTVSMVSRVGDDEAGRAVGARAGVVTAGAAGIAVWSGDDVRPMAVLPAQPKDVTGAGDALIAGTLFGVTEGRTLAEAAPLGLATAAITVESGATVAENLTAELLYARLAENCG